MSRSHSKAVVESPKGKIEIIPGEEVEALSWGTWTFRWTAGFDVVPGGGMEVILVPRFPTNRWSLPQVTDPTAPGYTTARADRETIVTVEILRWPLMQKPHGATLHVIQVGVGGGTLKKGKAVEVTYGDKRGGSLGTQVQSSAREVAFPIFVSSGDEPKFLERFVSWGRQTDVATLREKSDFNPSLLVTGGKAAGFHLVAPMEVEPGEAFDVRLAVLDSVCNAATGYEGTVEISTTDEKAGKVAASRLEGSSATVKGVSLSSVGFHRIYAIDPNRSILGVSNPIRVVNNASPVYWGEIHGHSEQSDGNGTPDEHYTYARDVALLDFACVCDHDYLLYRHPERWKSAAKRVREYSKPGSFIALLGYEGRLSNEDETKFFADINVYYRAEEEDMLRPFPIPLSPEITEGKDVILVPHTPLYGREVQMGTHWRYLTQIPAQIMPLVEVFSTHGNSEYYDCPRHVLWQAKGRSVQDALKKGFRLGLIGSSDYHEVLTGSLLRIQDTPRTINNQHMQARCGLAAVRAKALTRSDLFHAMRARKTYATSGIRAYVSFSINGHEAGSEFTIPSPAEPRRLSIAVAAPERIVNLQVIRNGDVMADMADGNWFVETKVKDRDPIPGGAFYYLRATTERMDFAWSSPIWVDVMQKAG
jgi:hypothetical protein